MVTSDLLNVSEAAPNMATSCAPESTWKTSWIANTNIDR